MVRNGISSLVFAVTMRPEALSAIGAGILFQDLRLQLRTLGLYREVLDDEVGQRMRWLVDFLAQGMATQEADCEVAVETFSRFLVLLLAEAADSAAGPPQDPWQDHLLQRILSDANPFSLAAERSQKGELSSALLRTAGAELRVLQALYRLSVDQTREALLASLPSRKALLEGVWPRGDSFRSGILRASSDSQKKPSLQELLATTPDWADLVQTLADYYASMGVGLFSRYRAFRWVPGESQGALEGVPIPDPVRLEHLVEYDREREPVLRNTQRFVRGFPGNNVLIYGDSGTGKSSLVKALLNAYGDQGLRLVEVPKERLAEFPYIARQLRGRKERFILFVDDLSFEEHETEYKALKALLEGSLEARPENVLVYATSNRRHLVREQFGDRPPPSLEDVHPQETAQEKLSLSDRFGVRVAFPAPDQERYLTIVAALAQGQGITLPPEELRQRALQWAQWQHGFSGRTARQFVDDLVGELAMERAPASSLEQGRE